MDPKKSKVDVSDTSMISSVSSGSTATVTARPPQKGVNLPPKIQPKGKSLSEQLAEDPEKILPFLKYAVFIVGAVIVIIVLSAAYRFTTIVGFTVFAVLLMYLLFAPFRDSSLGFLKLDAQKIPRRYIVATMIFSLSCSLIAVIAWVGVARETRQAQQRLEADVARNRELLGEIDSAVFKNDFDNARVLLGKISDVTATATEKADKEKIITTKTVEYYQNLAKVLSEKSNWPETADAINKYLKYLGDGPLLPDNFRSVLYKTAVGQFEGGQLESAQALFQRVQDYQDSAQFIEKIAAAVNEKKYQQAVSLFQQKKYTEAQPLFANLGTFEDAPKYLEKANKVVEEQKRFVDINKNMQAAEKSMIELDQALGRSDANAARAAFNISKASLDEVKKLDGKNPKMTALKIRLSRSEAKLNKIVAEQEQRQAYLTLCGEMPDPDMLAKYEIRRYLKERANDPDSIKIDDCAVLSTISKEHFWVAKCTFFGKNAFNATIRMQKIFSISTLGVSEIQ